MQASRPTSLPPNMKDQLYRALPTSVKTALRSRLQAVDPKEQVCPLKKNNCHFLNFSHSFSCLSVLFFCHMLVYAFAHLCN